MNRAYTVHIGPRSEPWPHRAASAPTRGEAQRIAAQLLAGVTGPEPHKAEVRECGVRLLDCFGRRGGIRVFHTYSAAQRSRAGRDDG